MSTPRWTKDLPSEQGSYWWWNEDEDSAPIHIEVYYSGCENSYFAPSGQYGWTVPQDVRDMGGWWMWLDTPNLPTSGEQDASTETELADMTEKVTELDRIHEANLELIDNLQRKVNELRADKMRAQKESADMTALAKTLAGVLSRQLAEVRFALGSDEDSELSVVHCADIEANAALTLAREKGVL